MTTKLTVTSTAFEHGGLIPSAHTCDGQNVSPPITWEGAPEGTRSYVLLAEDRGIPSGRLPLFTWVHWVVYNIPAHVTSLPECIVRDDILENGTKQGVTSFKRPGYGGPCPPFGTHRYYFKVYALDAMIDLEPRRANKKRVLKASEGHILAYGELMGKYRRHRR